MGCGKVSDFPEPDILKIVNQNLLQYITVKKATGSVYKKGYTSSYEFQGVIGKLQITVARINNFLQTSPRKMWASCYSKLQSFQNKCISYPIEAVNEIISNHT